MLKILDTLKRRFEIIVLSPLRMLSIVAFVGDVLFHTRTGDVLAIIYQDIADPFYKWLGTFIHIMFIVAFTMIILSDGHFQGDLGKGKKNETI